MQHLRDSILHPHLLLVRKLKRIEGVLGLRPQNVYQQPLQGLHHVRRQSNGSEIIQLTRLRFLRYWNNTGCFPQSRDPSLLQAHIEDALKGLSQLQRACLQESWGYSIWASRLAGTDPPEFILHLYSRDRGTALVKAVHG